MSPRLRHVETISGPPGGRPAVLVRPSGKGHNTIVSVGARTVYRAKGTKAGRREAEAFARGYAQALTDHGLGDYCVALDFG